VDIIVGPTFP